MITCTVSLDPIEGAPKLEDCYEQAQAAFLNWLEHERLPALADASALQRGKRRLHQTPEHWQFSLTAKPDRDYLSVTLSVTASGEGFERHFAQHRVWSPETGILVPLSIFLPRRKAKKYEKWAYSLEDDCLIVCEKGKMHKKTHEIADKLGKT